MAEALLRSVAGPAAGVRAASAGFWLDGEPASPAAVATLERLGLDLDGHRSRRVSVDWLEEADIVLGMARVHVHEAVSRCPQAWPKTFTLKDLVRRGAAIGPRRPGQPLAEWLALAHGGRVPADVMGDSPDDDVADPIGMGRSVFERTATELAGLIERFVGLVGLVPPPPARGPL